MLRVHWNHGALGNWSAVDDQVVMTKRGVHDFFARWFHFFPLNAELDEDWREYRRTVHRAYEVDFFVHRGSRGSRRSCAILFSGQLVELVRWPLVLSTPRQQK